MSVWSDYYKVLDVIDSCKTEDHLKSSSNMLYLWYKKHLDYEVYHKTYYNHVVEKSIKLGVSDFKIKNNIKPKINEK
jgi:hypothetical protein